MGDRRTAWIETTHSAAENITSWRVVVDGEVVVHGDVAEDASGARAYAIALASSESHGVVVAGWKHAIDRGIGDPDAPPHPRTTTAKSVPLLLYGWAICKAQRGREPVGLSPAQVRELESGVLPCPSCGDGCGATLDPSSDVLAVAMGWNGTRWHALARS